MNLIASSAGSVALVGNPNCGKSALFNRLTGSKQKVANYPGVTIERKEGQLQLPSGRRLQIVDLPGAYSFSGANAEETITRDVCLGKLPGEQAPDLLVCVVDATNLRLHLRFVLEVRAMGRPMLVAINKMDDAARRGIHIDRARLAEELGVPVVETVAIQRSGAAELLDKLDQPLPPISDKPALNRAELHTEVTRLLAATVRMPSRTSNVDERLDAVLLHPVWGLIILTVVMFLMFQAVFTWATPFMDGIDATVAVIGDTVRNSMSESILRSLLVDGVIAGVGGVIIFLPQILILFLFILALEESGYLPRAAFLLDRFMSGAGLTGRSFIPLLSSFACAVPGIMATRTIRDPRDRLATILVAPLMTCSARLPVYALLIAAFIPQQQVGGIFNLQGLVLFILYASGIIAAMAVAWVFKFIRRAEGASGLMLELPSYQVPHPYDIMIGLKDRAMIFMRRVGTIIFPLSIILWFLATFPAPPHGFEGDAITHSYAGQLGRALEVVFAPIGFTWQICIALVPGLAAREVFVSALATVYALSATDAAAADQLGTLISAQWSLPVALSLLAWYVFAPQCIATLAVIKRETNSWGTMALSMAYLTALAYIAAYAVYHTSLAIIG